MWFIRKKYVALEFYYTFPNSLVIFYIYFSPFNYKAFWIEGFKELLYKLGTVVIIHLFN